MLQNCFNQWDCLHNFTKGSFKPRLVCVFSLKMTCGFLLYRNKKKNCLNSSSKMVNVDIFLFYNSDRALNGFVVNQKCHLIIHGSTFSLVQFYNVKNIRNSHVHNICGCSTVVCSLFKVRTGFKEARVSCTVQLYSMVVQTLDG